MELQQGRVDEPDAGARWTPTETDRQWSLPLPDDERDFQRWSTAEEQERDRWPASYSGQQASSCTMLMEACGSDAPDSCSCS